MTNFNYQLNPAQATDLAQEVHNDIDDNGEIRQEEVIDLIVEEAAEDLRAWLADNIDWDEIANNDREAREDYHEWRNEQVRGWAG